MDSQSSQAGGVYLPGSLARTSTSIPLHMMEPMARLGLGQAASWACALLEAQEKQQSSLLGYYKCGQAPGLKTNRVFLSDSLPNKYISPEFCFLSSRSRGNRNKDSISLRAGRQLLEVFTALPQCGRPRGRALGHRKLGRSHQELGIPI